MDSVNVVPLTVDSIQIFAGQRYSFVLNTDQSVDNYWIRANSDRNPGFAGGINSAILRYVGATEDDPSSEQIPNSNPLKEFNLHPLTNAAAPGVPTLGEADVTLNLEILFDIPTLKFTVNGATFDEPTVPVLLQILSGASTPQDLLPAGSVYVLPRDKVIEISMPGGSTGSPVRTCNAIRILVDLRSCRETPSAPHSLAWPRVQCGSQRRQRHLQLRRPRSARRCEHRRHWRQCYHPIQDRQSWPLDYALVMSFYLSQIARLYSRCVNLSLVT